MLWSFLVIVILALLSIVPVVSFASCRAGQIFERASCLKMHTDGLRIDMHGKTVFIAGVADANGYGWAIAKACAEAGATILLGTWPAVLPIFEAGLQRGVFEQQRKLRAGGKLEFAKIYPLDVGFDTADSICEAAVMGRKSFAVEGSSIQEVVDGVKRDFGGIDYLVHAVANGPEVSSPLLETSREGYLAAASVSAYSLVSMVQRFGPILNTGGSILSLSYIASERVVPGYGGGMSSAKAALESDTRTLAFEAGRRFGARVNAISAGPLASRAARAIGGGGMPKGSFVQNAMDYSKANAPLSRELLAEDVGVTAAFLLSSLACGITGATVYVDNGLNIMGVAMDSASM